MDKDRMFFVAEDDGKILGYILGEPMKGNVAYLGLLTVAERYRQKGIGKKLVEAFRKRCDEKKLSYLVLLAPTFNKKTLEFYKKAGFKPSKTYIQFFEKRK